MKFSQHSVTEQMPLFKIFFGPAVVVTMRSYYTSIQSDYRVENAEVFLPKMPGWRKIAKIEFIQELTIGFEIFQ